MRNAPNPIPIDELRAIFDYDPATGLFRWKINDPGKFGNKSRIGTPAGGRSRDYIVLRYKGQAWHAHRVAFAFVHGWCPDLVDHKNNQHSDNWIDNLRPATVAGNLTNSKPHKNKRVASKGVYLQDLGKRYTRKDGTVVRHRREKPYAAMIKTPEKRVWLGAFHTEAEAAEAYKQAAEKYFGEYARFS